MTSGRLTTINDIENELKTLTFSYYLEVIKNSFRQELEVRVPFWSRRKVEVELSKKLSAGINVKVKSYSLLELIRNIK